MAESSTKALTDVALHPLVIINISDHITRIRANGASAETGKRHSCIYRAGLQQMLTSKSIRTHTSANETTLLRSGHGIQCLSGGHSWLDSTEAGSHANLCAGI
jgi:hypothetical protein